MRRHKKPRSSNHIPRPPNAFILFRAAFSRDGHIPKQVEKDPSVLSKIIGLTWKNLPPHEKEVWYEKAKTVSANHKRQYPDYAFRPQVKAHYKAKRVKDPRVRSQQNAERCEKIASLLSLGTKGSDLNKVMSNFDQENPHEWVVHWTPPTSVSSLKASSSEGMSIQFPQLMTMKIVPLAPDCKRPPSVGSENTAYLASLDEHILPATNPVSSLC